MKKNYITPKMIAMEFNSADCITVSGELNADNGIGNQLDITVNYGSVWS
ncbi:MAG: hypothetical protein IJY08_03960 [Clostridia bacterium]|nr:hypothetical protein [Clostridia bacterium]